LKKGEKVKYQVIENIDAQKGDEVYIFPADEKKVKLSKKQCESKTGCQFDLEVSEDYDGSIYLGESKSKAT
jgi:hypothetical protein